MEAVQRGLWEQPDQRQLEQMRQIHLHLEGELEDRSESTSNHTGEPGTRSRP
jgi:hypothetical protein